MIRLAKLCKSYVIGDKRLQVLREVSLEIARGEFLAIVGASGSGKSSLLNLIGCLDRADSGTYHFDGADISRAPDAALAHLRCLRIGFVFQGFHLIDLLSARQNVEQPMLYRGWAARKRRERALALLGQLGLADRCDHRPVQLSGGQQQRVALARALANDPDLIIADEPTGNLDSVASAKILQMFKELQQEGKTIVLVTHDADVAGRADRVVHMRDGVLTHAGVHS